MPQSFALPPYAEISQVMGWLQAETGESLLASEAELRSIIALMPHPLFIKNSQSQIIMMNQACEALWGVHFAETVGTDGSPYLPPEQVSQLRAHDLRAFASGQTCIDEAYVWNVASKAMRWMLTYKRPTYTSGGEPQLLICSAIDITERKQKEAELESALLQSRQAASLQRDAVEQQHRRLALQTQDNLAQNLVALKLDISMLHARTGELQPLLHERAAQALETLNASIHHVREMINELHPATLELGLSAALEWRLRQRPAPPCSLRVLDDSAALGPQQTTALFHLANAGIDYLSEKASALLVELNLGCDLVSISIASDGAPDTGAPILNAMRERLAGLGGTLDLSHSNGASLKISLPT